MKFGTLFLFLISSYLISGQSSDTAYLEIPDLTLEATLLLPESKEKLPVALIIAGSGPTDRDGNQGPTKNNSLKYLAEGLAKKGIASLRYDKRSCYPEYIKTIKEEDISFDHFVDDAIAWIEYLEKDNRFLEIAIIGHSQGSLIGILAAQQANKVTKMISLCGPGKSIGESIFRQLKDNGLKEEEKVKKVIAALESGQTTEDYPNYLGSLFRLSVQPFMISWMKYHPAEEVKKLTQDLLVIHGTTDSQISLEESEALADASDRSEMEIIKNMNHVLKEVEDNFFVNRMSYSNPDLPIHKELIGVISRFIHK